MRRGAPGLSHPRKASHLQREEIKQSYQLDNMHGCGYFFASRCVDLRISAFPMASIFAASHGGPSSTMPKKARELSHREVAALKHKGADRPMLVAVGGAGAEGLHLQLTSTGARSWVLRYTIGERRRAHGLGGFPAVSLAEARQRAAEARKLIGEHRDPLTEKRAARAKLIAEQRAEREAEQAELRTFAAVFREYLPTALASIGTGRSQDRWQNSIEDHILPVIGDMRVDAIAAEDIERVMRQPYAHRRAGASGEFWKVAGETARKTLRRVEVIFTFAGARGYCTGANPATWAKGTDLAGLMPMLAKAAKSTNHKSIAPADAPAWLAALHARRDKWRKSAPAAKRGNMSYPALEFVALTACRSGEAREALWREIDFKRALWIIPAERMKAGKPHTVPLAPQATALLRGLYGNGKPDDDFIFPSARGIALRDMALLNLLKDTAGQDQTVHGLRACFKTWADEHGEYPPEMVEIALAHAVGSKVEQAYRRGSMIEKRRQLMHDWAAYLYSEASS